MKRSPVPNTDLEQRIARLEARAEIEDLGAAYAVAVDDHDIETLVNLFTENGTFDRSGPVSHGRNEIRAFYVQSMERYALTLHTPQSSQIIINGDHAKGLLTGQAELALDGTLMMAAYRYADSYTRTGNRWRFERRRLRFMYAVPFAEMEAGLTTTSRIRWPGAPPQDAQYPETESTWKNFRQ